MSIQVLDLLASINAGFFGISCYLCWGLHLEFMQGFQDFALTLGHILSPSYSPYSYDVGVFAGGCFSLAVGAVNVRCLMNGFDKETDGAKAARQDVNFILYLAWLISFSKAIHEGIFGGSFAHVWDATFLVFAPAYLYIVKSEQAVRGPMFDALFKTPIGDRMDALIASLFVSYGMCMFLTMSLHLGFMQSFMSQFMCLFGMLEPCPGPFSYDLPTVSGGNWALAMFALNLPAFCGAQENKDYAEVRRFANLVFWCGSIVAFAKYPDTGSFYSVWTTLAVVFVVYLAKKGAGKDEGYTSI